MELYYAYLRLLVAFPLVIALIYFGLRFLMPYFAPALGMGRRMKVVERLAGCRSDQNRKCSALILH